MICPFCLLEYEKLGSFSFSLGHTKVFDDHPMCRFCVDDWVAVASNLLSQVQKRRIDMVYRFEPATTQFMDYP